MHTNAPRYDRMRADAKEEGSEDGMCAVTFDISPTHSTGLSRKAAPGPRSGAGALSRRSQKRKSVVRDLYRRPPRQFGGVMPNDTSQYGDYSCLRNMVYNGVAQRAMNFIWKKLNWPAEPTEEDLLPAEEKPEETKEEEKDDDADASSSSSDDDASTGKKPSKGFKRAGTASLKKASTKKVDRSKSAAVLTYGAAAMRKKASFAPEYHASSTDELGTQDTSWGKLSSKRGAGGDRSVKRSLTERGPTKKKLKGVSRGDSFFLGEKPETSLLPRFGIISFDYVSRVDRKFGEAKMVRQVWTKLLEALQKTGSHLSDWGKLRCLRAVSDRLRLGPLQVREVLECFDQLPEHNKIATLIYATAATTIPLKDKEVLKEQLADSGEGLSFSRRMVGGGEQGLWDGGRLLVGEFGRVRRGKNWAANGSRGIRSGGSRFGYGRYAGRRNVQTKDQSQVQMVVGDFARHRFGP